MIREAVRAATLGLRGVAFAIWLAPVVALAARAVFGLERLKPWQDWLCALPLSMGHVLVCPAYDYSGIATRFPMGVRELGEATIALFLAWLAGLAYLRPLASMAWFLGLAWGVPVLLLHLLIRGMQEYEGGPVSPMPGWDNSLLLASMLLAGALAIHVGRRQGQPRPGCG